MVRLALVAALGLLLPSPSLDGGKLNRGAVMPAPPGSAGIDPDVLALFESMVLAVDFGDIDGDGSRNANHTAGAPATATIDNHGTAGGGFVMKGASGPSVVTGTWPRLEFQGGKATSGGYHNPLELSGGTDPDLDFVQGTGDWQIVVVYRADRLRSVDGHQVIAGTMDSNTAQRGFVVFQLQNAQAASLYIGGGSGWIVSGSAPTQNNRLSWNLAAWRSVSGAISTSNDLSTWSSTSAWSTSAGASGGPLTIGAQALTSGREFDGAVGGIFIDDAALSTDDNATLYAFATGAYDLSNTAPITKVIGVVGDSTVNNLLDPAGAGFPGIIQGQNPTWAVVSVAAGGRTATNCDNYYDTVLDPIDPDVVFIQCGINDIQAGNGGVATFNILDNIAIDVAAEGDHVVWGDILPRKGDTTVAWSAPQQTEHDAFNAAVVSYAAGEANATHVGTYALTEHLSNADYLSVECAWTDGIHTLAACDRDVLAPAFTAAVP